MAAQNDRNKLQDNTQATSSQQRHTVMPKKDRILKENDFNGGRLKERIEVTLNCLLKKIVKVKGKGFMTIGLRLQKPCHIVPY